MSKLASPLLSTLEKGHVWLVGSGPGDPALLTLQAVGALEQADIVLHDSLVDARILGLIPEGTRREAVGKRRGRAMTDQDAISARLVLLARQGLKVVRLKGGDPFVFGRGAEEILVLARERVPFHVVPGITSGLAALCVASIPATHRSVNHGIILATGQGAEGIPDLDWCAVARTGLPVVFYMAHHHLEELVARLLAAGFAARLPAALIASATRADQHIVVGDLEGIVERARVACAPSPAIFVVGQIVKTREALAALGGLGESVSTHPSGGG